MTSLFLLWLAAVPALSQRRPGLVDLTAKGEEIYDSLKQYYESNLDAPAYEVAIQGLISDSAEARAESAEWLVMLLDQALADQEEGRSSQSADPGSGAPQDDAAILRGWIATRLASHVVDPGEKTEAQGPAIWLVSNDPDPGNRLLGMQVTSRIQAREADQLILAHLNDSLPFLLAIAAREVGRRRLGGQDRVIRRLCLHWSREVREAASSSAQILGLEDIPEWRPENGLKPRVEIQMIRWRNMAIDQAPEEAPWRRFHHRGTEGDGDSESVSFAGWLVHRNSTEIELIDWFGERRILPATSTSIEEETLSATAELLIETRARYDRGERGQITQQLGLSGAPYYFGAQWRFSVPEALIASWAFAADDRRTAASLVLPQLESAESEGSFFDFTSSLLGARADRRMIAAFTSRDYHEAGRIAAIIADDSFKGFWGQKRAKELKEQLPHRIDDFQELRLPSTRDWGALCKELSRREQISFLAKRLRLLSCRQGTIPGRIYYDEPQFDSLPGGNESKSGDVKRQPLVNPFVELQELRMKPGDLLQILPLLESSDFILAYDLQRFSPRDPRHLHRVSWVVAELVNEVAHQDLVDVVIIEGAETRERRIHIAEIASWCQEHADDSETAILADAVANGRDWYRVGVALFRLRALDKAILKTAITSRLITDMEHEAYLLRALLSLDSSQGLAAARRLIDIGDADVRFWSSMTLILHGKRSEREGFKQLTQSLEAKEDGPRRLETVIDTLLSLEDPNVRDLVFQFGPQPGDEKASSFYVLQQLFLAGHEESYRLLCRGLDGRTSINREVGRPGQPNGVDLLSTEDLAWMVMSWKKDAPTFEDGKNEEAPSAEARALLDSIWTEIQEGKKPQVNRSEVRDTWEENWNRGIIPSNGWIRIF